MASWCHNLSLIREFPTRPFCDVVEKLFEAAPYIYLEMDQYLLIPFLGGWTSIYQLFWCSPGVQGFDTHPFLKMTEHFETSLQNEWVIVSLARSFGVGPTRVWCNKSQHEQGRLSLRFDSAWWLIPLSKWVITPVINGISRVNPLITGVITHLLSGMSHQVMPPIFPVIKHQSLNSQNLSQSHESLIYSIQNLFKDIVLNDTSRPLNHSFSS